MSRVRNEPSPPPEGWRLPTERELAQAQSLKLNRLMRYFRDGWRRWDEHEELWHPCDPYGRRERTAEVIEGGRTRAIGTRKPVQTAGECSIKYHDNRDETQEPDTRVAYPDTEDYEPAA